MTISLANHINEVEPTILKNSQKEKDSNENFETNSINNNITAQKGVGKEITLTIGVKV